MSPWIRCGSLHSSGHPLNSNTTDSSFFFRSELPPSHVNTAWCFCFRKQLLRMHNWIDTWTPTLSATLFNNFVFIPIKGKTLSNQQVDGEQKVLRWSASCGCESCVSCGLVGFWNGISSIWIGYRVSRLDTGVTEWLITPHFQISEISKPIVEYARWDIQVTESEWKWENKIEEWIDKSFYLSEEESTVFGVEYYERCLGYSKKWASCTCLIGGEWVQAK